MKEALQEAGYTFATAELSMFPTVYNEVAENNQTQFDKMLEALEDDDDVQEVYTNAEIIKSTHPFSDNLNRGVLYESLGGRKYETA